MSNPRALVIPFGVPSEGRGLGIGLAALVHACVHLEGGGVALAQLQSRKSEEQDRSSHAPPVEAFVPPAAWRDIARRSEPDAGAGLVLTGSFEPPTEGHGAIRLLAFDPRDGRTRARVDASIDDEHAGAGLVGALERLWSDLGGQIGALKGLRELGWESLESVLRAERCALLDPTRGEPHDRLAAMMHFGRAIEEAPEALYPAERLARMAFDTAARSVLDPKVAAASVRALERALDDAPGHAELGEALATLLIRAGRPRDAERRINAVVAAAPKRSRPYTILSQALRAQGKLDGAEAALDGGFAEAGGDASLHTERGMVLAERHDLAGARAAWQAALANEPLHVAAFVLLADLVRHQRDASAAQTLIDAALASSPAHPELLWRAVQLALLTEPEGLARAARVTRLCERILAVLPDDAPASLTLARALIAQGDAVAARAHLARVERAAPASAAGAEAQVTRLALEDPDAEREVQRLLLTAKTAPLAELPEVAARARRLATLHNAWPGWLAAGIVEQRRGRWVASRGALEVALEIAPGATLAHLELAGVLLEMDDAAGALGHAERALALEGDSPRAIRLRARALAASGRWDEARAVISRGIGAFPDDEATRGLGEVMRRGEQLRAPRGWQHRLRELWERRRR